MLIAKHEVTFMRIAIHGVKKLYAYCNTWNDALCSYLYME